MTPTHDAYLDNGTDIGLTVGNHIIAYAIETVNIPGKFIFGLFWVYFGNSKINLRILFSLSFLNSSSYAPV